MNEIWILIDINQDDELDQREVREFTRLLLSRPMLGKVMIAIVAADDDDDEDDDDDHDDDDEDDDHDDDDEM